jgi:hypothetical protein
MKCHMGNSSEWFYDIVEMWNKVKKGSLCNCKKPADYGMFSSFNVSCSNASLEVPRYHQ